jgi:hypothetical protein
VQAALEQMQLKVMVALVEMVLLHQLLELQ